MALMFPQCVPSPYGLGKHGWVSCTIEAGSGFDSGLLAGWVEESYRAVAPKRLAAALPPPGQAH
jgi:predicted DNA-binding protein (MmcQ/YjbR family)